MIGRLDRGFGVCRQAPLVGGAERWRCLAAERRNTPQRKLEDSVLKAPIDARWFNNNLVPFSSVARPVFVLRGLDRFTGLNA